MEVPNGKDNQFLVALYELLGTAALTSAIIMSGGNLLGVVLTFLCLLQLLGPISGGHMNPAVSVGVFIKEGKKANVLLLAKIILAQTLGAALGILIVEVSLGVDCSKWSDVVTDGTTIPGHWMPSVCPIDPFTGECHT